MQTLNWADIVEKSKNGGGGDPVPASDYPVAVASCEAKKTKDGTKDMLKIKAKIAGGPHDGRVVWNNLTLTLDNDNAVAIFMRHLAAFGLDESYFLQNPTFEQIAATLVGRTAIFRVSVGTWNGKAKNDVDDVLPNSAGATTPSVGPSAVPQPTMAPAPAAPAPVPSPAPVAPVAAPAPAPVAPPVPTEGSPTPAPQGPPF